MVYKEEALCASAEKPNQALSKGCDLDSAFRLIQPETITVSSPRRRPGPLQISA
jgi:hypothetical protein